MNKTQFRIQMQILQKQLLAQYWIAMATTGAASHRIVCKNKKQMTKKEKTKAAMDTAIIHIHSIGELIDTI